MSKSKMLLAAVALVMVVLSAMNASWFAPSPKGGLVLIAHRGIGQPVDRTSPEAAACTARAMRATDHNFIENTQFAMQSALRFGAGGLLLDARASADGHAMIFRDERLECRTNGTGRLSERPLAYLKSLDVGHGYTPDNGRTFPLRGRGFNGMLTIEEVLRAFPREQLIFDLADPRAAEALAAGFARGSVAIAPRHGFTGPAEALARIRQLTPNGWILDRAASDACLSRYRRTGWLGLMPDECRGATLHVPHDGGWTLWGWPYRFLDRMAGADARLFLSVDPGGGRLVGLEQAEQFGEVGRRMAGMLLIEDMHDVGRALVR